LDAVGVPDDFSAIVAGSLVRADLCGVPSEGIERLAGTVRALDQGRVDTSLHVRTLADAGAFVALDCGQALGAVVVHHVAPLVVERARAHGMAIVTVANCAHLGQLTDLAELIAEDGVASTIVANNTGASGRPLTTGAFIVAIDPLQVRAEGIAHTAIAIEQMRPFLQGTRPAPADVVEMSAFHPGANPAPAPLQIPDAVVFDLLALGTEFGLDTRALTERDTPAPLADAG
jgi:LDH2 family malate/lactate/ureidoglycolate dehydrogenase